MEKKGSRSVQPASKGLTSDSKKSQDGTGGKVWPRSGRRREPAGSSLAAKNESSRKSTPQRSAKPFDIKRPRARGAFNPGPVVGRTEATRLEDDIEIEMGSVIQLGSKKQSLNHLLNFNYSSHSREGRSPFERGFSNSNRMFPTKKHKYNKEHFLQANCQFVVNTSGDYKQYMNNPDALVDWSLIEQVTVQVSDYPSCPICLYPPVAAKMTRCGHIYCWSCVLHYLSLSDKNWRECPICYESIHKDDLKSVTSRKYKTFNVEDVITFKLMKRLKGSLVTYPAPVTVRDDEIFNLSDAENVDCYSKLLVANQDEILSIIERENHELIAQMLENGDCPENCFIEQALKLLKDRREKVEKEKIILMEKETGKLNPENVREMLEKSDINDATSEASSNSAHPANTEVEHLDISPPNQQSKFHYFYQASDGQHTYLHAINARMLEHTYGALEHGPETITGQILEKEGGSMTEDLRKRLRYLQHLPVTCQFEVAEIQLEQPIVSPETLQDFQEQLEVRKKRRSRRAREEKRREKKIADQENRLLGRYPAPNNMNLYSQDQFPCFDGRARTESECTQRSEGSLSETTNTPPNSLSTEQEHAGPSFAKMLASAKKSETVKGPVVKASPVPKKLINVTGQKINSNCFTGVRNNKSDSEPDIEDFEPIPPSTSLGDAIVKALQKAEKSDVLNDKGSAPTGKKKKMKNRQKVLFTTSFGGYVGK